LCFYFHLFLLVSHFISLSWIRFEPAGPGGFGPGMPGGPGGFPGQPGYPPAGQAQYQQPQQQQQQPDQPIPTTLQLLPLYSMSLQKSLVLRGGTEVRKQLV
jgi:hypothetical protein